MHQGRSSRLSLPDFQFSDFIRFQSPEVREVLGMNDHVAEESWKTHKAIIEGIEA